MQQSTENNNNNQNNDNDNDNYNYNHSLPFSHKVDAKLVVALPLPPPTTHPDTYAYLDTLFPEQRRWRRHPRCAPSPPPSPPPSPFLPSSAPSSPSPRSSAPSALHFRRHYPPLPRRPPLLATPRTQQSHRPQHRSRAPRHPYLATISPRVQEEGT